MLVSCSRCLGNSFAQFEHKSRLRENSCTVGEYIDCSISNTVGSGSNAFTFTINYESGFYGSQIFWNAFGVNEYIIVGSIQGSAPPTKTYQAGQWSASLPVQGGYENDGSILSQIMADPKLRSNWTHTFNGATNWVNIGAAWTSLGVGIVFAAPTLAAAPGAVLSLGARGLGTYLAWAGPSTGFVIGNYLNAEQNYVEAAEEEGLGALNVWQPLSKFLENTGNWWTLNRAYLDEQVALGRQVFLYGGERVGRYLQLELDHLTELGINPSQMKPIY